MIFCSLYQCNYLIFLQRVCKKTKRVDVQKGAAILFTSLPTRLHEPYHVVQQKLPTFTFVYHVVYKGEGGTGYVWLFSVEQVMSDWLNHTMWFHSNRVLPRSMEFQSTVLHFFYTIDTNMLCRLFDDLKYMDIYLPICQEYCYLGKQKISLYFSTWTCEHL